MFSIKNKIHPELKNLMDKRNCKRFRVIIEYRDLQKNILNKINSYKGTIYNYIDSLNIITASLTSQNIERLIEYPEIRYIALDSCCFLCGTLQMRPLSGINVRSANRTYLNPKYAFSGKGIGIGLIDTGVYPHTDLNNPRRINFFDDIINGYHYPYDDDGHGTAMAGIICGNGSSSSDSIYRGVAPQSHLCVYKAFSANKRAFASDVLFSIDSLINMSSEYNIRILCLPFEMTEYYSFIENLFYKLFSIAVSKNIIPIVPSGSNTFSSGYMPGISNFSNAVTVGGINTFSGGYSKYPFSSSGSLQKNQKPDISAACVNIISLNTATSFTPERNGIKLYPPHLESPYAVYSGTSTACAFICGMCALILENNPGLTFKDVLSLLKVASRDTGIPKEIQGSGIPDLNTLFS